MVSRRCYAPLTFFRGHRDKRGQDLLNVRLLTVWAFDVLRVVIFEALVDDKRLITILTVIFVGWHKHSLHGYARPAACRTLTTCWAPLTSNPA
jgi:hypothetical protein